MSQEGFVCGWLEKFSPDHEDSLQFGCVKGTCTTHCLIELHHSWAVATDTPKCYVRVMFLDFSRAFDHIEHDILLKNGAQLIYHSSYSGGNIPFYANVNKESE